MKKLLLYCTHLDSTKLLDYCTKELKNSRIDFCEEDNTFYFSSLYSTKKEPILIHYRILIYDENLILIIKNILKDSFNRIGEISSECFGPFDEEIMYSEIYNYVNKCSYEGNEPSSIFEFVANLFYKYLLGHKMQNGNKRLSLLFLINLLRYFGYHFYWSKGNMKNYNSHKYEIENWVVKLSSKNNDSIENKIKELSKWIKENCVIALEWQK